MKPLDFVTKSSSSPPYMWLIAAVVVGVTLGGIGTSFYHSRAIMNQTKMDLMQKHCEVTTGTECDILYQAIPSKAIIDIKGSWK